MDFVPPPPQAQLIIEIDDASYDAPNKTASITMSEAFQKSTKIEVYHGKDITLIYQDKKPNLENCPDVRVPLEDVKRSINFSANTVTITISNIEQNLADEIAKTLCLNIDTETVKKVSNPNYGQGKTDPNRPFDNLND